jgi:hypothetical protein
MSVRNDSEPLEMFFNAIAKIASGHRAARSTNIRLPLAPDIVTASL